MNRTAPVLSAPASHHGAAQEVTLLDLLDRLLEGGVAIQGEVTLAVADIDLVDLSLRLMVSGAAGIDRRSPTGTVDRGPLRAVDR